MRLRGWLGVKGRTVGVSLLIVGGVASLAGCGASGTPKPAALSVNVTQSGKTANYSAPKSVKGGVVNVVLTNRDSAPHFAQLVQIIGDHTLADVQQVIYANGKVPTWFRAAGGVGITMPGETATATVNLAAGTYAISDLPPEGGGPSGPPLAGTDVRVTTGTTARLPSTSAQITAKELGKDKYAWSISGLRAGANTVAFHSQGTNALHVILAVPVKGNPSLAAVNKGFASNGPPPTFLDFTAAQNSAALDGGRSEVTQLNLKPGNYVFLCPLTDRNGGKRHFQEGQLTIVAVK